MSDAANWLDHVIVVNESNDPAVAGDVQIYLNEDAVSRHLEHWYVHEKHLALTGTGQKAKLGLRDELVVIERVEPFPAGPALLNSWLKITAEHVLSARVVRSRKGNLQPGALEEQGALPTTIEGLIAYIGFVK